MENKKNRIYDIVVIACIYLLANGIPFSYFIKNSHIVFACNSILLIAFLFYYFHYIKKYHFEKPEIKKITKECLLFIPFLILPFSNFFYCLYSNGTRVEMSAITIIEGFVNAILVATSEELIFRSLILKEISIEKNNIKTILLSSLIFGLVHLLNISTIASIPACLVQCCYSFFLGLFLGTTYLYSKNIILPIILHFSFNFVNDKLVTGLYNYDINLTYYVFSILIGVIMFIYLVLVLVLLERKRKNVS